MAVLSRVMLAAAAAALGVSATTVTLNVSRGCTCNF